MIIYSASTDPVRSNTYKVLIPTMVALYGKDYSLSASNVTYCRS